MSPAAIAQLDQLRKEVKYNTVDYAIQYIVDQFSEEEIIIPDEFQRGYVWNKTDKCKFIESILLGLPIPFMFFSDRDDGRVEVIDGAQRTQTLAEFLQNDLKLTKLSKLNELNGLCYQNLNEYYQRKFSKTTLRIVQLSEETSLDTRKEIFARINTTGKSAKPAEIRRGSYYGSKFKQLIDQCSKDEMFLKLCPMSEMSLKRFENEELVTRFFVYLNHYKEFKHDVNAFIDEHYTDDFDYESYLNEFQKMIDFVSKHFPKGFARDPARNITPRVRFEAISVGTALALRINPNINPVDTSWVDSDEFQNLTRTDASNSKKRLESRIEYVRDQLLRG